MRYVIPLLLWFWAAIASSFGAGPYDVCAVFKDLPKLHGKDIEIAGYWEETDHGMFLRGHCKSRLVTQGYHWIQAIWLARPSSIASPPFALDAPSVDAAYRAVERQRPSRGSYRVWATFIGRLETGDTLLVATNGHIGPRPLGYGHLGAYPAQLILRSIKNVRVIRSP